MPEFGSVLPLPTPPRDDVAEAAVVLHEEQRPGEVTLDAIIRAQCLAPQVVARITDLENMLWRAAIEIEALLGNHQNRTVEEIRLLLKNKLEIPEAPE